MTDDQLDADFDNRFIFEGCPNFHAASNQLPPVSSSDGGHQRPPSGDGGVKHLAAGTLQSLDLRNAVPDPEELTNWYGWGID